MNWYTARTGNHQGLVIDEDTGRNVAVTYDAKDASLVAAAPALLQVVEDYLLLCQLHDYTGAVPRAAYAAVQQAKGE